MTKGSRIAGRRKDGSVFTRDANAKTKPWTAEAAKAIWGAAKGMSFRDAPCRVSAVFYCQRPKAPKHDHPSRGDVDKMARALLDAIVQAGAISDDRHVVSLNVSKCYSDDPRVEGVLSRF